MPRPEFTTYEEYLIASVKTVESSAGAASYGFTYLLMGAALFFAGVYQDSIPMMIAGFGIVAVGRLYEEHWYRKQAPTWRSIIQKYEAAVEGAPSTDVNATTLM